MLRVAFVLIDILHVPDCPNLGAARTRLREALHAMGASASVREVEVATPEQAVLTGMCGSPTILVDGRDPFEPTTDIPSVSCRLYATSDGIEGAPSVAQLTEALSG
jgi:hypothetical protein